MNREIVVGSQETEYEMILVYSDFCLLTFFVHPSIRIGDARLESRASPVLIDDRAGL